MDSFYLHCLIFVWGFLLSFGSAVVKFCFNFCHYHKQHPLVIIWVEDAVSQHSVELRLNKLPGVGHRAIVALLLFSLAEKSTW